MKFKVGDLIIVNNQANEYGVTIKGWKGEVLEIENSFFIRVKGLPGQTNESCEFSVLAERFDLLDHEIKESYEIF